jgi:hypothetical protein
MCFQMENNTCKPSSAEVRVAEDAEEQPFLDLETLSGSFQYLLGCLSITWWPLKHTTLLYIGPAFWNTFH